MKRSFLIAGGTLGGLGAVMAITPPQLGSSESALALGAGAPAGAAAQPVAATTTTAAAPSTSASATTAATKSATVKKSTATKSANTTTTKSTSTTKAAAATQSATPAATQSASATPTAAKTTAAAAPASNAKSGTFTGDAINVGYGIVQVEITVQNGKITDAQAVSAPTGRNDRWTQMAVPVLRQRTLAAQGSNISGVSGASYTSYGWYKSLVSALAKAGL